MEEKSEKMEASEVGLFDLGIAAGINFEKFDKIPAPVKLSGGPGENAPNPRIDTEESKIMEISDLPDLESGMKIWRKALEDSKSREAVLKQEIEELKSRVNILGPLQVK